MTDLEKLSHLIKHWIEHNNSHAETYNQWASKTESLGRTDLSNIIKQIAIDSKKLNELFEKASDMI